MADDWDAEWDDDASPSDDWNTDKPEPKPAPKVVDPKDVLTKPADPSKKEKRAVLVIIAGVVLVLVLLTLVVRLFSGHTEPKEVPQSEGTQGVTTQPQSGTVAATPPEAGGTSGKNSYVTVESIKLGKVKESNGLVTKKSIILFDGNNVGYRINVKVDEGGTQREVVFLGSEKLYESVKEGSTVHCEYSMTGSGGTSGRSLTVLGG